MYAHQEVFLPHLENLSWNSMKNMLLYTYDALFTEKVACVISILYCTTSVWLKNYSAISVKSIDCSHGVVYEA